jgi:hypothetical protein
MSSPHIHVYTLQRTKYLLKLFIAIFSVNTQTLIDASNEVGLEVNTGKTKYMLLSHQKNAGQNHDIKTVNRCFENVAQFRYLGTTVTNQNLIQEEIKRRVNSRNACYLLFSPEPFVFSSAV